ncbi:transcriptional regulator, LuxR family [Catenulispora acidiphila DSM 44928]|uniref:Transcriptional regulator, LuxR family n=1 Tax=Catenulispora acidiphila (strain DSM 44928 / JCM 14897 / NBRC 102108 / NRRL B-24433 / ID139908) TaxID=479433 RepID=C7PW86_CATAD|nr:LuxR C-terminal-related transcriptional regulator [Catenulispora acidiphila]ACU73334.1 transcriptional regulator, LuxR family [Catenulispora acidiphila DSM 44928]
MREALDWAPTRARLLPPDTTDFTGRLGELAALTDPATFPAHTAALFVVTGSGGTGKTALAVRAARLAGDSFPDAHLYADLGGYTGSPTPVPDVLRRFLRALGAAGPLPEDRDELVGMFRTALAGQRALVVLDDAADEAQVRPLLPTGPDALAIVTSRNWLGGLAGALPLRLGPMPDAEAAAMLARVLGARWTGTEDVDGLLALCGHLPLAIRIAAARLLSRPQMTVDDLCDQLRDERRRLKRLTAGDITVHGVLTSSYDALEPGDRKVFRRLALLRGFDFCTEAAAQVAGISREEAQEALDRMADRSVVRPESESGRYSLHSLARLFAADRLAADDDPETARAAEAGHLRWVLSRLRAAADLVNPCMVRLPASETEPCDGTSATTSGNSAIGTGSQEIAPAHREAALAWLDAERHNLLALVRHHRRFGDPAVCWTVPDALRGYYHQRRRLREWTRMADIGMAAAQREQNLRAQAAMSLNLGMAAFAANRLDEAGDRYQRAVELGLGSGWREIEAAGYRNLAGVALGHGDTARWEKYMSLWAELNERVDPRFTPALSALPALSELPATGADRGAEPGADNAPTATEPTPADAALTAVALLAADIPQSGQDRATAEEWSVLSRREQTVARLVVQGLTNQQIAKRIRCSPETVKFHLRNIFRKLGIGSRVEIARFVLASGAPG